MFNRARLLLLSAALFGSLFFGVFFQSPSSQAYAATRTGVFHSSEVRTPQGVKPHCVSGHDGQCYFPCAQLADDNDCTGFDPIASGCTDDAQLLLSATISDYNGNSLGVVNLLWSTTCQSNWAQVLTNGEVADLGAIVAYYSTSGWFGAQEYTLTGTTDAYTNMIYAPTAPTTAIGSIYDPGEGLGGCNTVQQAPGPNGCGILIQ